MWPRRSSAIRVGTHDDLLSALKSAPDEIVVEGDSRLIEQAENIVQQYTDLTRDTANLESRIERVIGPDAIHKINPVPAIIWMLLGLLFVGGVVAYFLLLGAPHAPQPAPPSVSTPNPLPTEPLNYVALGWIAVAIVAIVLVYRVVIKAMQGERDVEISWKITEKVSGRLVITKVQKTTKVSTRPPRKPKPA